MRHIALLVPFAALALMGCDKAQAPTPSDAIEAGLPSEATSPANPATSDTGMPVPPSPSSAPSADRMSSPVAPDIAGSDECGVGKLADLIGKSATPAIRVRIAATAGAGRVRIYTIGDALTMDYSPQRLNVELDKAGRISKMSCG